MAWVLFLLVAAGVSGILVWDIRRKAAAREATSKKRFEEIFQAQGPPPGGSPQARAPVASAAPSTRDRFLGQRETLLYRLLKAGIPDHEIFANVALPSVVGANSDPEMRRLAQYCLDFVVCDKGMQVVAAVKIEPGRGAEATGDPRVVADCLKSAGIRLVRLNLSALPRREEIRALVFGQSGTTTS